MPRYRDRPARSEIPDYSDIRGSASSGSRYEYTIHPDDPASRISSYEDTVYPGDSNSRIHRPPLSRRSTYTGYSSRMSEYDRSSPYEDTIYPSDSVSQISQQYTPMRSASPRVSNRDMNRDMNPVSTAARAGKGTHYRGSPFQDSNLGTPIADSMVADLKKNAMRHKLVYGTGRETEYELFNFDFDDVGSDKPIPDLGTPMTGVGVKTYGRISKAIFVADGEVEEYINFPRINFVCPDKDNPVRDFNPVTLNTLRSYAENIRELKEPKSKDQLGFWENPDTQALMMGFGTLEASLTGTKIAYVGSCYIGCQKSVHTTTSARRVKKM
ncbi:hypothetical protein BJX76DRAFT_360122 [Aspergillus varians]